MYVIQLTNNDKPNETRYIRHDPECGFLMDAWSINTAYHFKTLNDAMTQFTKLKQEKERHYVGSTIAGTVIPPTIYPPDFLHRGLGLCHNVRKGSGVLSIQEIVLQPTLISEAVQAEIICQ